MPESEARERILSAVRQLLDEGVEPESITVRKIAARAGVGIGTVSYHFRSKDRLVYEAVAGRMSGLAGALVVGEGSGSARHRLRQFFLETAELALRYHAVFRAQMSYDIVHGDMSICYHITPLLKEHFGGVKTDLEIKLIALQLVSAMQAILLKMEAFHRYSGLDVCSARQREEAVDAILGSVLTKCEEE